MLQRFLTIVVVLILTSWLLIAAALQTHVVQTFVIQQIQKITESQFKTKISVQFVEPHIFPPSLDMYGIQAVSQHKKWAELDQLSIVLYPIPSINGLPKIKLISLKALNILNYDVNHPPFQIPASNKPSPKISISNVIVSLRKATIIEKETMLTINSTTISLKSDLFSDYTTQVSPTTLDIQHKQQSFVIPISLEGTLYGSIQHPIKFSIEQAQLGYEQTSFAVKGDLNLLPKQTFNLRVLANLHTPNLNTLLPSLPRFQGNIVANAEITSSFTNPHIIANIETNIIHLSRSIIGTIRSQIDYENKQITFKKIELKHPEGGSLNGMGTISLQNIHQPFIQLNTQANHASLPIILEESGLKNSWVRMLYHGQANISGTLQPLQLKAELDGNAQNFNVLNTSYKNKKATSILHVPNAHVRIQANISNTHVHITQGLIERNETEIYVQGKLNYTLQKGLELQVTSNHFDALDLGPIGPLTLTGQGKVSGTVIGPYSHIAIHSDIDISNFSAMGYPLGRGIATLHFEDLILNAPKLLSLWDNGKIEGYGKINFRETPFLFDLNANVHQVDISNLLYSIHVEPNKAQRFTSNISGNIQLNGTFEQPHGTIALSSNMLQFDDTPMGPLQLNLMLEQNDYPIYAEIMLMPSNGFVHGQFTYDTNQMMHAQVQTRSLDLKMLSPFLGNLPIQGDADIDAQINGLKNNLSGKILFDSSNLSVFGLQFEHTSSEANIEKSLITGSIGAFESKAIGNFSIDLQNDFYHESEIHYKNLSLAQLWPQLPQNILVGNGDIQSKGYFIDPDSLEIDILAKETSLNKENIHIASSSRPFSIHYKNLYFYFSPMEFQGNTLQLDAKGLFNTEKGFDFDIHATGDFKNIPIFQIPDNIQTIPTLAQIHITGMPSNPIIAGDAQITNVTAHIPHTTDTIDNISANISFLGQHANIQKAHGNLGQGNIDASGEFTWGDTPQDNTMHLNIYINEATIHPTEGLTATGSAHFKVEGLLEDLGIQGNVHVDSALYQTALTLNTLIPNHKKSPLASLSNNQKPIRLNIDLQAPKNIVISSNVIDAELSFDLHITGTTERTGLLGNITPKWAKARYRDNLFTVTRASIDFVEEYRIFSQFQIEAKTEACGIQITTNIQGDSEQYNVIPAGRDEQGFVPPEDILLCIQFGLRKQEFNANQGTPAGISDILPGSLDALWTISGLDNRVKKLLPIEVDEIRISSGWSSYRNRTMPRLVLGKDLGNSFAIRYSRAVNQYDDQTVSLEYKVNKASTLQGTWFSASDVPLGDFGIDVKLHWELK